VATAHAYLTGARDEFLQGRWCESVQTDADECDCRPLLEPATAAEWLWIQKSCSGPIQPVSVFFRCRKL